MIAKKKLNLRVLIFHIIVTGIFLFSPLILYLRSDHDARLLWTVIMLTTLLPFYFLNVTVLIPRFLNNGKFLTYFGILIGTFVPAYFILVFLFNSHVSYVSPPARPTFDHSYRNQPDMAQPLGGPRPNQPRRPAPFMVFPLIIYYAIGISVESIIESEKQKRKKEEALKEKVKAEMSFLKSQINPHFLFNSLNSIYSLSYSKSEYTNEAILLLSDMMRYMLYESKGDKVQLDKEIKYIENYIALQKYRISKKSNVSIRFKCSGKANRHQIEPMLFIPFIENAFKHGISYNEVSIVDIKLDIHHDKLVFEIFNTRPHKTKLQLEQAGHDSGIGFTNTARRLDLLYQNKYKLRYHNGKDLFSTKLELNLI